MRSYGNYVIMITLRAYVKEEKCYILVSMNFLTTRLNDLMYQ